MQDGHTKYLFVLLAVKKNTSMFDTIAAKHIRNYWDWRATSFDDSSAQQQSWWQVYAKALDATRSLQILDIGMNTIFRAPISIRVRSAFLCHECHPRLITN